MKITIADTTSLLSVQNAFSEAFPFLQIRFYNKPHQQYHESAEADRIAEVKTIGDIMHTHAAGILEVLPGSKVAAVEKEFRDRFGLSVQILKKEKNTWQQTASTDDYTLRELNEMGSIF